MTPDTPDDAATPPAPTDRSSDRSGESPVVAPSAGDAPLVTSQLGSGLLAQQPGAEPVQSIAVLKVCPLCGTEYETAARFCPADGTALRPKGSDSLVGCVLADRYHILKRIGEGGMGRVYLGEHVKMNRQCAIKVMSPALVNDAESSSRFAREASNAARIIHPNVAAVFDYGESDGLVYLVMEYVDGEPLSRLLAREAPFSLERSVDLARQIADGLGAAHELGIVHRDLKPDNILITRSKSGREIVKVVDFGIAKAMQEGAGEALTRTGLVIGTPEFMSPEQLLGDPVDARSDLYALGCILHLMLTASPAFEAPTREQMIKRRLSEDPPHAQALDPGLPDSIDGIIRRLLARTPDDRYGSAAEVRDGLAGTHARRLSADGLALPRVDTPRSAPTQVFEAATTGSTTGATTQPSVVQRPRGRRRIVLALGAVALGVGVVFGAFALQERAATERVAEEQRATLLAARQDSIRRADSATTADSSINMMVDSAARARRTQDSLAAAARSALRTGVLAAIRRYTGAITRGDLQSAKQFFPNMPASEEQRYQKILQTYDVRLLVDRPDAVTPTITGPDSIAVVNFVLREFYTVKGQREETATAPKNLQATLEPTRGGWRLVSLTNR